MRPVNRVEPNLPVGAYQTYQIVAPSDTHWRDASCEDAGCMHHARGWRTVVDESQDLGKAQAHYIRRDLSRKHTAYTEGTVTTFVFEAGQQCFQKHRVRIDRPELFLLRGGDWRGNPQHQFYKFDRPDQWVDHFGEHQDRVADQREKG